MKNLLMLVCGLLFCTTTVAQKDFERTSINILPRSELVIAGKTNVNKFDCRFDMDLIENHKNLKFTKDGNKIHFHNLKLKLSVPGFDCGHRGMNRDFRDLLMAEKYPFINIEIQKVKLVDPATAVAFIKVNMAGQENNYSLPVDVTDAGRYRGNFIINIRDFGLEPPKKAMGLIEVDEEIEVQFDFGILN